MFNFRMQTPPTVVVVIHYNQAKRKGFCGVLPPQEPELGEYYLSVLSDTMMPEVSGRVQMDSTTSSEILSRTRTQDGEPQFSLCGAESSSRATIAALYARVSTSDGRQDADNQLAELRRFAASQDWAIVREYLDHESGSKAERPQFGQLLKDASQRKFDVVLFWSLDRFTREGALATLQHLNTLSGYGVAYRSLTEPYLDSCGLFKDAIIAILGTIAKQERIRLSERVKAGLDRAKRQGTKIGRPRRVFNHDELVEYRHQGVSWKKIGRTLRVSATTARRAYQQWANEVLDRPRGSV